MNRKFKRTVFIYFIIILLINLMHPASLLNKSSNFFQKISFSGTVV